MLKRKDVAPDFKVGGGSLYETLDGSAVVVFFYPKAFTRGCTREAIRFRRDYEKLKESGCEVIGVSRDDEETNARFRKSLDLPYPLVSDPDGRICRDYKVSWPIIGRAKRVTYLIGKDRQVRLALHDELNMDAHADQACAYAPSAPTSPA
jgi:thioredoxin-dependent peroxiredoxin